MHEPERGCYSVYLSVSHKAECAKGAKLSSAQLKLIWPG